MAWLFFAVALALLQWLGVSSDGFFEVALALLQWLGVSSSGFCFSIGLALFAVAWLFERWLLQWLGFSIGLAFRAMAFCSRDGLAL